MYQLTISTENFQDLLLFKKLAEKFGINTKINSENLKIPDYNFDEFEEEFAGIISENNLTELFNDSKAERILKKHLK